MTSFRIMDSKYRLINQSENFDLPVNRGKKEIGLQ